MDFRAHIRSLAAGRRRILEIGPSYNPILLKRDGFPVETLDHADRATLVEKYTAFGVDPSRIEEVDHVTTDVGSLRGDGARFDMIVASHVIEHVTDLVQFLDDCDALLTDDGVLALIVPDKRYSFDAFRPLSSPGAAIDAHHSRRRVHVGGLYDHYAYFALNRGQLAWGATEERVFEFPHSAAMSREVIDAPLAGDYVDAHEWVFVPESFRFVIGQLRAAGFVRPGIVECHPTLGYEFFALLSRAAPVDDTPVAERLEAIQRELDADKASAAEQARALQAALDAAHRSAQDLTHRLAGSQAERDAARERVSALEREVQALKASTSWRLTRPLRGAVELVRRVTRG